MARERKPKAPRAAPAGNRLEEQVYAYLGSTGTGKTTQMLADMGNPRRLVVWSPKEEIDRYADLWPGVFLLEGAGIATSLLKIVRAAGESRPFRVVIRPPVGRTKAEALFDVVCRIVMHARNVTFVAEELHTVTRGSWAPDGWSELVMMGRGYGAALYGCSQRPASMDKDFLGNCSRVRTGRLAYEADAKAVAVALRVPAAEVLGLTGYASITRNLKTGELVRTGPDGAVIA